MCAQIAAIEILGGVGRSLSTVVAQWLNDALEPREVFAETWRHEVQPLLMKHLREQDFETTVPALNDLVSGLGWGVKQRGRQRPPTGTPTTLRIHNIIAIAGFATRGGSPGIVKLTEQGSQRYGLRFAYRQALVEMTRHSHGVGCVVPDPVTEEEISAAIEAGVTAVPQRFLDMV